MKHQTGAPSLNGMKKVVKSVVQDDVRSNNFLFYGAPADYGTAYNVAEEGFNDTYKIDRR